MTKKIFILIFIMLFISVYAAEKEILYWTCGMHPTVKMDKPGNCPICNMKLIPVYKEEEKAEEEFYGCVVDEHGRCPKCDEKQEGAICREHIFTIGQFGKDMECPVCGNILRKLTPEEAALYKGVVSRVRLPMEQVVLAGVETLPADKHHLFKEIRTVGKVAYDPELAVAQEEFISALEAQDKIKEGKIEEISRRYEKLVESSKRKLRLLGMSEGEIEELAETRKVQTSLILPEKKMWIYGDVYEYEISWVKAGQEAVVTSVSFPGEEFKGIIKSINPVLDPKTRSVRIRAEVDNPNLKLQPEMYVDIVIRGMYMSPEGEHMVLAVPIEAVLDTGMRKIVWIEKDRGEYEGREVITGPEAVTEIEGRKKRYYPILRGISPGDKVVVKANFLIDSQSQLTGSAAAVYGGALGEKEEKKEAMPPGHVH